MTRFLSVILFVGMIVLALAVVLLVSSAAFMVFPSELQGKFFEGIDHSSLPKITERGLAIACGGGAIIAAAWFLVLKTLRSVVQTVGAGDPFVPENISRLRLIWLVIAGAELLRMIFHYVASLGNSAAADLDIRIGTWFLVFVIATLSEAFRYGAEMRQEQELTI
ncbi:DUF2975 domain-containing protein [Litorimonas sp. RW-G-Af-16]|uniref:DUF2975 domain-containing protein n=1 Tax=Litorimonas sp. RW-G-Af-16 TaxID=3241168 RepID=UPI00390CC8EA